MSDQGVLVACLFVDFAPNAAALSFTTFLHPLGPGGTVAQGVEGNVVVGNCTDSTNPIHRFHGYVYDGTTFTTLDYDPLDHNFARGIPGNKIVGQVGNTALAHGWIYDGSLAETKTPKSRRRVDLPQFVVDALTKHRAQSVREGFAKAPWVFCNSTGGPLRRTHFRVNHFKPLLTKAELPDIRFHDLRHTSATLLRAAGVHLKVVQERLGHSQIGITLDTYSHVVPTMQLEATSKLDTIMRSSSKPGKSRRRA